MNCTTLFDGTALPRIVLCRRAVYSNGRDIVALGSGSTELDIINITMQGVESHRMSCPFCPFCPFWDRNVVILFGLLG